MTLSFVLTLLNFLVISYARKNILFLVADDMRPEINAYRGKDSPSSVHPPMYTPNLDALASKSLLLKRAHVQQAVCSPSRTSLLTGRRPDTTHVYDLHTYFRNVSGNFVTIPQYFKMKGYESIGIGKIFHPGHDTGNNDPVSWTKSYFHISDQWEDKQHSWKAIPNDQLIHKPLQDKMIADQAVSTLQHLATRAKSDEKPFFLAVGFHKPHLPFIFPQSFLDHYPMSSIHLPNNQYAPNHMPHVAWSNYGELRTGYHDISVLNSPGDINTTLPSNVVLDLRRAYYSAISFTDSLVGEVLSELARLGLDKNTIVSFFGDHGWQLGEHGLWCKHTNFELATHAPMMIHIPGKTDNGIVTEKLTEFVDLFPTLVEAAEFDPLPLCPEDSTHVELCHEGMSLMHLINNSHGTWKNASFSQYPRHQHGTSIMGYTMRTDHHRYTEWVKFNGKPTYKPDWSQVIGLELYDHQTDPDENNNIAHHSHNSAVQERLSNQLHAGWRHSMPHTTASTIFGR